MIVPRGNALLVPNQMHSLTTQASPVAPSEREDILDVLRGFAILGIFLANTFGFTGYGELDQAGRAALPTFPTDAILRVLATVFVDGKFYSLFSLLFGIGFSVLLLRSEQKGVDLASFYERRLLLLMLIGAAHLLLLWEGDIVLLYALLGGLLPWFRKCSNRTLLLWAGALIASPLLIDGLKVLLDVKTGSFLRGIAQSVDHATGVPTDGNDMATYLSRPGSGWREWRDWMLSGYIYRYAYLIESNRLPKVLGVFLLGLWVGRNRIYAHLDQHVGLLRKLRLWGLLLGLTGCAAMAFFENDHKSVPNALGLLDTISYAAGVVPLSLAYVAILCLCWLQTRSHRFWKVLAPVGRMALTNYLTQTVVAILLFYGVGLGLGRFVGPTVFLPMALGVYALQVIWSNWWFRHFNFGPVEWIWRQFTYGKRLPIRREEPLREVMTPQPAK